MNLSSKAKGFLCGLILFATLTLGQVLKVINDIEESEIEPEKYKILIGMNLSVCEHIVEDYLADAEITNREYDYLMECLEKHETKRLRIKLMEKNL